MTEVTLSTSDMSKWSRALPFWVSYILPVVLVFSALQGGWWVILTPVVTWYGFGLADFVVGSDRQNAELSTTDDEIFIYRLATMIWPFVQAALLVWCLWYIPQAEHLNTLERVFLFISLGVITGTIGINYSHELMHQKSAFERWLADILLAMVLYSHFRSEHLLVHHRYVGTPRDAVTARYNESFYRFYPRVLRESLHSAFQAETEKLAKANRHWTHSSNPFWRYWILQAIVLFLAILIGGWSGLILFLVQVGIAIWQLELVNYVEHYGLTRKHLGEGEYEHVRPHHSWNADQKATNWLLINLQRHSDHHYKPSRRYPLLQTYTNGEAQNLPYGYPVMTIAAMIPTIWRRMMNPRVRRWRQIYYPEITDWRAYNKGQNPQPR